MKVWTAALLAACLAPSALSAQGLTTRAAATADVATLDGIIAAFYDVISHAAGQPVDWARDSTLYLGELRFKIAATGDTANRIRIIDHHAFATENADVSRGFFEREIHRVTNRFGPIAQVFSTYEWRTTPDGAVGGRGINSIELYFDGRRWWISSAMWTAETPNNPIPRQYLPGG
ncbi:MAG TPA: hypothetical protein VK928_12325 [Longimicrobiales bacterium]|nr:hypothetical protein [Longimicrobiales bacterium]